MRAVTSAAPAKTLPSTITVLSALLIVLTVTVVEADDLIVPGQRIGPVRLGMTAEELYRTMGEPSSITSGYVFANGLTVRSNKHGRTISVIAVKPGFRTIEGLGVGESELAMRAKLGTPEKRESGHFTWCWYKRRSLAVELDPSWTIIAIAIYAPD